MVASLSGPGFFGLFDDAEPDVLIKLALSKGTCEIHAITQTSNPFVVFRCEAGIVTYAVGCWRTSK
jgi:hypothetical protein